MLFSKLKLKRLYCRLDLDRNSTRIYIDALIAFDDMIEVYPYGNRNSSIWGKSLLVQPRLVNSQPGG